MGMAIIIVNYITIMPVHFIRIFQIFNDAGIAGHKSLLFEPNHGFIIPESCDLHVKSGEFI